MEQIYHHIHNSLRKGDLATALCYLRSHDQFQNREFLNNLEKHLKKVQPLFPMDRSIEVILAEKTEIIGFVWDSLAIVEQKHQQSVQDQKSASEKFTQVQNELEKDLEIKWLTSELYKVQSQITENPTATLPDRSDLYLQDSDSTFRKIPLEIVGLANNHTQIGNYTLVLRGEANGLRRLPIIIGGSEAQAIALELEDIKTNRPMAHDLLKNCIEVAGYSLVAVILNEYIEGIWYTQLVLDNGDEMIEIDSRPSDATALALRFKAPIYIYEPLFIEAGIDIENEDEDSVSVE